jgi:ligand-binding sensor domain-containing protein
MRIATVFLLCFWSAGLLAAVQETQTNRFRDLTEVDGLSESDVTAVVQDKAGFMWLGTEDGLDRYDGFTFQVFRPISDDTQSLPDAWIDSLHVDPTGQLWVATRNGLARYDDKTESFTRFLNHGRRPLVVYAIADAEPGAFWLNTNEGLEHLDTHTSEARMVLAWNPGIYSALLRDSTGIVWVGMEHGLTAIDAHSGRLTPFHNPSLDRMSITALHETATGTLWIGTSTGEVFSLSPDRKQLRAQTAAKRLAQSPITDIAETADGVMWVGTESHGLMNYSPKADNWALISAQPGIRNGLPADLVERLYVDHDGKLWIALRAEGVAILNPLAAYFDSIGGVGSHTAPLSTKFVTAVMMNSDGGLWVGTENGLNVFSRNFKHVRYYAVNGKNTRGLQGHIVNRIFRDHEGRIWLGMHHGGLCLYQLPGDRFRCYDYRPGDLKESEHNGIMQIAEDPTGIFWVGTEHGGLYRFDPATGQFQGFRYDPENSHAISSDSIVSVTASVPGEVWVGTWGGGLNHLDTATGRFTQFSTAESPGSRLPNNAVISLLQTSKTTLWIGTADGFAMLNPETGQVKSWTMADGLPNAFIDSITADKSGMLWLGTDFGLVQFDPTRGVVAVYRSDDGLPADEFNIIAGDRDSDDTLYMGTMNGVVSFSPGNLPRRAAPLHVTLTDLLSNGSPVPILPYEKDALLPRNITQTSALVLPYSRPQITLAFSALDATNPAHVRYAFKFRGLDQDWIELEEGRHTVDYHPETAGHVVFEVRAVAGNGTPLGDPTSLDVTVLPAPWASASAYVLYSLAALGVLAALIWGLWQRISSERQQHELMRQTEFRLKLALRASGQTAWTADVSGASIYAPELMAQLGYGDIKGSVMSQAFMQLVHPDDRTGPFGRAWAEALAATGQVKVEFRMRRREGGYMRLQMSGQVASRDGTGRPLTAAGTFMEVDFG